MSHRLALLPLPLVLLCAGPPARADELARCRAVAEPAARLACYDALADAARPAAASAPAAVAVAAVARFGLPERSPGGEPEAIVSTLPGAFEGWGPDSQLRLANGQVWQVVDGSSAAVDLRDPAVRVVRTLMGGFRLEVQGLNRSPRVRRVK